MFYKRPGRWWVADREFWISMCVCAEKCQSYAKAFSCLCVCLSLVDPAVIPLVPQFDREITTHAHARRQTITVPSFSTLGVWRPCVCVCVSEGRWTLSWETPPAPVVLTGSPAVNSRTLKPLRPPVPSCDHHHLLILPSLRSPRCCSVPGARKSRCPPVNHCAFIQLGATVDQNSEKVRSWMVFCDEETEI